MAWPGSLDGNTEGGNMTNVYVSTAMKRDGVLEEEERPHVEPPPLLTSSITHQTRPSAVGTSEKALMKRTLVAQSKKIQQLMTKVDSMEAEREAMRQQVDALRMAVFEASTRAEQTAEQCKRDAVDAAVHEITRDREAFADGRREALKRIGELEDALEIALKAAGGVHKQLLDLGLSCEDLGKTSVHLSIAAKEAQPEDKPALDVAGVTIEAIVGVMRTMEGSGVFDILDPVEEDSEDAEDPATFSLDAAAAATAAAANDEDDDAAATDGAVGVLDAAVDAADPLEGDGPPSSAVLNPTTAPWDVQSGGGGSIEGERNDDNDDEDGPEEEEREEGEEAEGGDEEGERGAGLREGQEAEEEEEEDPRQPALVARGSDGVREAAGGADGRGREGRSISTSVKHGSAEWDRGSAAGASWKNR